MKEIVTAILCFVEFPMAASLSKAEEAISNINVSCDHRELHIFTRSFLYLLAPQIDKTNVIPKTTNFFLATLVSSTEYLSNCCWWLS